MNKFTPGPWRIANGCQIRSERHQIARAWMMRNGEGMANAAIISASPELLDCVEEAISMLGERLIKDTFGYDWHEKASKAIDKARGDSWKSI